MGQIDTSKLNVETLMKMFDYGFISARDLKDELSIRGLEMNIHGDIETEDGELYNVPVENRWQILDL